MKKSVVLLMAFAIFTIATGNCYAKDMIQVKGSDTLINLVQRLAESYMEKNPGKLIAVTGGGSGTGIAALINKRCDIADSSRLMKQKEIEQANSAKVDPKRIIVAIDGLSIIVNEKNPVTKLTREEVGKIYKGDIKNWKQVGGDDMPINLYGRQGNSGTYDFMLEVVLKGEYSPKMRQMNGSAQIGEAVKQDVSGIGYVGVGYVKEAKGIKVLEIALKQGDKYFSPLNSEDVENGNYPIARPLNQYVNGNPKGDTLDFISFELSKEGQKIVEDEGFFPVPKEYQEFNNKALGI